MYIECANVGFLRLQTTFLTPDTVFIKRVFVLSPCTRSSTRLCRALATTLRSGSFRRGSSCRISQVGKRGRERETKKTIIAVCGVRCAVTKRERLSFFGHSVSWRRWINTKIGLYITFPSAFLPPSFRLPPSCFPPLQVTLPSLRRWL